MCLSGQNGLHWGAGKWYYELMAGDGPDVPGIIVRHLRRCLACRKQVDRWKEAVIGAGGETGGSRSAMKRDVIDTLSLHFGCLEERVTCGRVKPFLPGLLMPSVQIRIPTPITVHIDHCPACAEDLDTLRHLELTAEQLERLERLYGGNSGGVSRRTGLLAGSARLALGAPRLCLSKAWQCRRARSAISAFVRGHLDDLDPETLDHLCTCPHCRSSVQHSRQRLLEDERNDAAETSTPCADEIPAARLFDYVVPYGRTTDGQDRADESHVATCRVCRKRIQELDSTIYGIAERPDSDVATVYSAAEQDTADQSIAVIGDGTSSEDQVEEMNAGPVVNSFTDVYPDYPIRVQVMRGRPQPVVTAGQQRVAFDPRVRLFLKTAVAAAAMIPLAFIFLNTHTASGTTLAQVVKSFEGAQNVYLKMLHPDSGRVIQELWISRDTDVVLRIEGHERTMYDLARRKKYINQTTGSPYHIMDLSEREFTSTRRLIDTSLGFTFQDTRRDTRWAHLANDAANGLETYELTYSEPSQSEAVSAVKWEIRIDPATRLPVDVRTFRKTPVVDGWRYLRRAEVHYITAEEMAAVLRK